MDVCTWIIKHICPICFMEYEFDDEPDFECRNCHYPLKNGSKVPVNILCDNALYEQGEVVSNTTGFGYINSDNKIFWYSNPPEPNTEFILSTIHKLNHTTWMPLDAMLD